MEIKKLIGGKTIEVTEVRSFLPDHLAPAVGKIGYPGNLDGNVALTHYIAEAARLEHGLPSVARVRAVISSIDGLVYLLLVPAVTGGAVTYRLRIRKNAPKITGLAKLFREGGFPVRRDLWYYASVELVQDEFEGFAAALNWTEARTEARDYLRERRLQAEADKRRREKKRQGRGGQASGPLGA